VKKRKWAKNNKDKVKEYRCKSAEKNRERSKKWYLNNKKLALKNSKEWQRKNKDKVKIYSKCSSAKRRKVKGKFTKEEWVVLIKKYNNKCVMCKKSPPFLDNNLTQKLTVDHIIAVSKWNTWIKKHPKVMYECNDILNLQPLCGSCNSSKGSKVFL